MDKGKDIDLLCDLTCIDSIKSSLKITTITKFVVPKYGTSVVTIFFQPIVVEMSMPQTHLMVSLFYHSLL